MRNLIFPSLILLAAASKAMAQTDCARPEIQLLRNSQALPATAAALVTTATLRVAPAAGCPEQSYRFRHAEITLVRHGRPVLPIQLAEKPQLDLRPFQSHYQTGDQLRVFIAYQNIATVAPDGTLTPLLSAKDAKSRPGKLDLQTADSKGITYTLPLAKP
ncbi:hypothetical protein [Hymenobacter cellulosilyticus]|uniref:Uncharacterized protein n=1 Tax=Hymenobacter cellulosilyticus TaxID=2932248 RepID=A0A8T9Q2V5_9BACT|nr:hypothetical protein [Hymenobacter cellulosilyticus]UOQ70110.1 hypothetical protein MUN79_15170 [Hymenobacter cellulosilyticus]